MGLTLLAGPANAGKVERLLDRYLDALDREPVLIVPNASDVDRVERDLLRHAGALVGGQIGTFDDLFRRLAPDNDGRPPATDVQRALVVRRVLSRAQLNGWTRSARFAGFADALSGTLGELESGLVDPGDLEGGLAALYEAYRAELDALGLSDQDLERRRAAELVTNDFDAWDARPVFAYGFEDLTGAQWALLEALAARGDVTVSLPYEPGRSAFASLERTASDLAALASPRIEELGSRPEVRPPALAHLERSLFGDAPQQQPSLEGSIRWLEGAGRRGTLELLAEELLELLRGGVAAEKVAIICPSVERWRAALETTFSTLGIPYAVEGRVRLDQTPFGRALLALLRFAWQDGGRGDLYAFLRSPYSGLSRTHVDYLGGPAARPGCAEPRAGRGGDHPSAGRSAASAARAASPCSLTVGSRRVARPGNAAGRLRARSAAGGRGVAARPARLRGRHAHAGRAQGLGAARRLALTG